jgi:glycosyltransferase involved in cell wall biosynthesis
MRKFDSSLRWQLEKWIAELGSVDILVGIPCYNNEDTISHVVSTVGRGLHQHFGERRGAILISDGGSLDDTREMAYKAEIPTSVARRVSIYRGAAGKGTAFRAVFEAAASLNAKTIVVLDSDLRSVTPDWVRVLATPVHEDKADFVTPLYRRHKYDGTITNNIVYPLTRALFGFRVRQPIGGDYAFSGDLARQFAGTDVWETDVARFGIDIWMTLMAMSWDKRIVQVFLGTKIHSPKDPAADLSGMFCQVISTIFYVAGAMAERVRKVTESAPVEVAGRIKKAIPMEPVDVNFPAMDQEFLDGIQHFDPMYRQVLAADNYQSLQQVATEYKSGERAGFSGTLWARILYDFLLVYQVWNRNRRRLVDILVPLYFGRLATFCRNVAEMDEDQVEEAVDRLAQDFEREKKYLLENWS